jgi:hypothetical protein
MDEIKSMTAKPEWLRGYLGRKGDVQVLGLLKLNGDHVGRSSTVREKYGIPPSTLHREKDTGKVIAFRPTKQDDFVFPLEQFGPDHVHEWPAIVIQAVGNGAPALHFLYVGRKQLGGESFAEAMREPRGRGNAKPPPADLAGRDLSDLIVEPRLSGWRISHGKAPLLDWSDNEEARFSRPDLPFKVLYLGMTKETCFWERFGEEIRDQALGSRALSERILAERVWKTWTVGARDRLRCLDLTKAETLRRLGADGSTFLSHYGITQARSKALMEHPAEIEGLIYNSRLNTPGPCLAIFDRPRLAAKPDLFSMAVSGVRPVADPELLALLLREQIALLRPAP